MRPRVIFALLLAVGATLHLFLLRSPAGSAVPFVAFCGWLLISACVVVAAVIAKSRSNSQVSPRERLLRPRPAASRAVEGLFWFSATAGGGLVIHILSLLAGSTQQSVQRGMWILFFLFAIGGYLQMRGAPGDASAPAPDHSPIARGASRLRKAAGWFLSAVGALIVLRAIWFFSGSNGRADFLEVLFIAGGAMLLLVGAALVLVRGRHDA